MEIADKTPLEHEWTRQREKAVAWLRVAFAVVAIAVIELNPSRVSHFPTLSLLALWTFLLYGVVVLFFTHKTRPRDGRLGAITTALDVVWINLIVYSTGGTRTPFFFYNSFPVITASVRWGLKGSVPVALVAVAGYTIVRLTLSAESGGLDPIGIDIIVVRSLYMIVLAGIFGYISEFEQKQNQKLLALSRTAGQVAALQERRRIMYELHDGILQSLATLILRLESCRRTPRSAAEIEHELREIEELTRSSMKEIRQFLAGKDTQPLVQGTLAERLRDELQFLRDGMGVTAILETEPEELELEADIEREVYYVLREGLTNITRHSHAGRAEIHLWQRNKALEGTLVDNGIGMNLPRNDSVGCIGLKSMKERIQKIGGELDIKSSPGEGTNISFVVPLAAR